eukprot:scaffold34672_cov59-Phaeocystis_antarctica.AAC.1
MAARRWRTTYMHPIVAPPPKHPIMNHAPNSADGTDDTPLTTGRFSATRRSGLGSGLGSGRSSRKRYAVQAGTKHPVTIAAKPRVDMVMKVTITAMRRKTGPVKRLRTLSGSRRKEAEAASNVQHEAFHAIASPFEPRNAMGTRAHAKPMQMSMSDLWPSCRPLLLSTMRCAAICEVRNRSRNGKASAPSIVRQGSTSTIRQTETALDDIMMTRHLKPLWYIPSRNSASLLSVQ